MALGNPLEGIEKELHSPEGDSPKLLQYLRDAGGKTEEPTSARVIFVGKEGVGKTKTLQALGFLLAGFFDKVFGKTIDDEPSHTSVPLNFPLEVEWGKVKYRLLVTDPPGEPHLAPAVQYFVSGEATVAVVMVDGRELVMEDQKKEEGVSVRVAWK